MKAARAAKAGKRSRTLLSERPYRLFDAHPCIFAFQMKVDTKTIMTIKMMMMRVIRSRTLVYANMPALGDGCKYIADATKTKNGCLKYPCEKNAKLLISK